MGKTRFIKSLVPFSTSDDKNARHRQLSFNMIRDQIWVRKSSFYWSILSVVQLVSNSSSNQFFYKPKPIFFSIFAVPVTLTNYAIKIQQLTAAVKTFTFLCIYSLLLMGINAIRLGKCKGTIDIQVLNVKICSFLLYPLWSIFFFLGKNS